MKIRHYLALGAFLFSAFFYVYFKSVARSSCSQEAQLVQLANEPVKACSELIASNPLTWPHWLLGKSSSTQFHFLDFAELLFSKK